MIFQLRSEETGIKYVRTMENALAAAHEDETIWKISFEVDSGERIRLVKELVPGNSHVFHFVLVQLMDEVAKAIEQACGVGEEPCRRNQSLSPDGCECKKCEAP